MITLDLICLLTIKPAPKYVQHHSCILFCNPFLQYALPSHLTSCAANKSIIYSCITSIGFCSVPILYIDSTFHISTSWSLFMLCCLCFCPVSNFRGFSTNTSFTGWECQPHAQPPTWRTRVSLFVQVITFDLSGTWYHTSSVTTASKALGIIWPRKPHHYVKVGCNSYKNFRFLWLCFMNIRWRERTNKMQLIRCLLSNILSQHVSGIIMPIIRRTGPCRNACGVLPVRRWKHKMWWQL